MPPRNRKKKDAPQEAPTTPVVVGNGIMQQDMPGLISILVMADPSPDDPLRVRVTWHLANYDPHHLPGITAYVSQIAKKMHEDAHAKESGQAHETA